MIRHVAWRSAQLVNRRITSLGIMFGLVAGAAWGLAFLIPNMLSAFSSLEITLGRYLMYGLYSLLIFSLYKRNPFHISAKVWLKALLYAFTGNIGYFFFLVLGIQYAGATVTTLLIGTLPITISVFGNLLNKEFPFKIMLIPACSIFIGVLLLVRGEHGSVGNVIVSNDDFLWGVLFCIVAVILWTWYGISNANFLKRERQVSADLFATLIGIQTLALVILFSLLYWMANPSIVTSLITREDVLHYLIGIIVLGIVTSWIATWAWNQASIRLPVTMAGMIIVFERWRG